MDLLHLPWYVYILLGIMIISAIITKVLPFLRHVKRTGQDFLTDPNAHLAPDQLRALAIGGIMAEQTASYINSLSTGLGNDRLDKGLAEWWGISSREEAQNTLNWLLVEGHREGYEAVLKAVQSVLESEWKVELAKVIDDPEQLLEYAHNLSGSLKTLREEMIVESDADLKRGILAWDMGRAVVVARMCYDKGYLSQPETWDVVNAAAKKARETFSSWKEFGKSYMIGRAMWSGDGAMLSGLISITKKLWEKPESPWMQNSWK